jgi:hypothetical protein
MKISARVAHTSGQGVSRYAYQKAYSLGQHGGGNLGPLKNYPLPKMTGALGGGKSSTVQYGVKSPSILEPWHENISYGDTMRPFDAKTD